MKRQIVMQGLIVLVAAGGLSAAELSIPAADQIPGRVKPGHPRLLLGADTPNQVRARIKQDPLASQVYDHVRHQADRILKQDPVKYDIPDGKRLLSVSRRVKDRVLHLAFVHRMTGDRVYAERAWLELKAAAGFKDWNPSHFLDTAEMTFAFAVGYDWLYDAWTTGQRDLLERAIVNHGLTPAMKVYQRGSGWVRNVNNWNQVCNGGIGLGALAIADRRPELSGQILHDALRSLPRAMGHYAPDGAGTEGVTYWSYGSLYNILLLAGLQTAIGTDFGLSQTPGFKQSGDYQIYLSGAGRHAFNFADCGEGQVSTAQHFWMARAFDAPRYSWFRIEGLMQNPGKGGVLDLLWWDDAGRTFDPAALPKDRYFRRAETASMRSSWTDPNALVLAIQAGDNENLGGHRHLDLGSFILEASGERWIIDSGTEKETYQRHRNRQPRWAFYRVRAEGHNTLVLNPGEGPDQSLKAKAGIVDFKTRPSLTSATVDLTEACGQEAESVRRTFMMKNRQSVIVRDELSMREEQEVWWFAHTQAAIALRNHSRTAVLSQNGKHLTVDLVAPPGGTFLVMDAEPLSTSPKPEKQADNRGRRKLALHLESVSDAVIEVVMTPGDARN